MQLNHRSLFCSGEPWLNTLIGTQSTRTTPPSALTRHNTPALTQHDAAHNTRANALRLIRHNNVWVNKYGSNLAQSRYSSFNSKSQIRNTCEQQLNPINAGGGQ